MRRNDKVREMRERGCLNSNNWTHVATSLQLAKHSMLGA